MNQAEISAAQAFGGKPLSVSKRRIKSLWQNADKSIKVGDIITVRSYGTFGCWDNKDRWIDWYHSEAVK